MTTNQQAIRDIARTMRDSLGNLEPNLDVYPDRPAPVVRDTPDDRELTRLTWGMPTPPQFLKTRDAPDTGVTNIRNVASPHWRRWLGVENRCLLPATAFSEYGQKAGPVTKRRPLHWFALDDTRPLFFFAGLWTEWHATRGSMKTPRPGDHHLFAFLTCEPNSVVKPIHPKAMPVILTTPDEIETWMTADWAQADVALTLLPPQRATNRYDGCFDKPTLAATADRRIIRKSHLENPMDLTQIARWPGKSPAGPGLPAHPAAYHMLDVAAVAEVLLADHPRRDLFCLLIALHDLGKIGIVFRKALQENAVQDRRHWEVTEAWLHDPLIQSLLHERLGGGTFALLPLIAAIAGHHDKPPTAQDRDLDRMRQRAGPEAQADATAFVQACLGLWPLASLDGLRQRDAKAMTWFLAGATTVADWIGSNTRWFSACVPDRSLAQHLDLARQIAPTALREAGLLAPPPKADRLFPFALRPMQQASRDIALPPGPTLAVIEDETGAGKTEAAFILLQRMMCAGKGHGAYVALPTMATADAMFSRARRIVGGLFDGDPSLTLAHGRAGLSVDFRELRNTAPGSDAPVCGDWLAESRRRALLADIGIGTIDQALLAVLPTRFATLRNWGLSRKILIVDEAHELGEPYLQHELATLLRLHAMQGGSAILLTATLPLALRARLSRAFAEGAGLDLSPDDDPAYPSLSIVSGAAIRSFGPPAWGKGDVAVERLATADAALDLLTAKARAGAACAWVRNAVDDAMASVAALRARGVQADLLHARYSLADRKRIEAGMMARFGRDGTGRAGQVLVGTQVLEASLDLDFDVMVSDLAPVASLIQRAGRLWRHMDIRPAAARPVPAPVLHVLAPDPDAVADDRWLHKVLYAGAWVYPQADQWRTAAVLACAGAIRAPANLRALIEAVHGPDALPVPAALERAEIEAEGETYARANRARQNTITIEAGYRDNGGASDDAEYPTRLGQDTRTLMLLKRRDGRLTPWADAPDRADAEALSEVSASVARLARLDLPDQIAPDLAAFAKDWPDWRRAAVTLCVVAPDGTICEGLAYDADLGLTFR